MNVVTAVLLIEANIYTLPSQDGLTAIYYAAKNGHAEIVKLLVEANVDPNMTDKVNWCDFCRVQMSVVMKQ